MLMVERDVRVRSASRVRGRLGGEGPRDEQRRERG
jgi:hypothetical protein